MNNILTQTTFSLPATNPGASSSSYSLVGGDRFSVQCVYTATGVANCYLTFQGSNDGTNWFGLTPDGSLDGGNWSSGASSYSVPITATGQALATFPVSCLYFRVNYALTAGTISSSNTLVVIGAPI